MVDGLDLIRSYAKNNDSSLPDIDPSIFKYTGVEISNLLNDAARDLHKEYNMNLIESTKDAVGPFDILYDRSVTNYAFDSAKDVASFVNKSECALLNIFLSKRRNFHFFSSGKEVNILLFRGICRGAKPSFVPLVREQGTGPSFRN